MAIVRWLLAGWGSFFLSSILLSQVPAGYYDGTEGLTGQELKAELFSIINDHQVQSYSSLWTAFQTTDKKGDGTVWDMYSDVPGGNPAYTFTFIADQCGNYGSEGDCYNREHSFPKSWFNDQAPMNTDLFHIYPTDGYVNGQRSNYPYGDVGSASWTSTNGSRLGSCTTPGYTGTVFEPIDEYKGDFARTYFYMMTCYMNQVSSWSSPMLDGGDLSSWARNLLLTWSEEDPVSAKETDRNNEVYAIQDNRNPYIDHPEWTESIWGEPSGIEPQFNREIRAWYSHDHILFVNPLVSKSNLLVFNALGMEINHFTLNKDASSVPVHLSTGIYFLIIQGQKEFLSGKILVP